MASVEKMNSTEYPIDLKEAVGSESDIERGNGIVQVASTYVVDRKLEKKTL